MTVTMNSFQVWINEGVVRCNVTEVIPKEQCIHPSKTPQGAGLFVFIADVQFACQCVQHYADELQGSAQDEAKINEVAVIII